MAAATMHSTTISKTHVFLLLLPPKQEVATSRYNTTPNRLSAPICTATTEVRPYNVFAGA